MPNATSPKCCDLMRDNATARIGRLLAPYAHPLHRRPGGRRHRLHHRTIRSRSRPGCVEALAGQLDSAASCHAAELHRLREHRLGADAEHAQRRAAAEQQPGGPGGTASTQDIAGSTPAMVGMRRAGPGTGPVLAGVFYVAEPFDDTVEAHASTATRVDSHGRPSARRWRSTSPAAGTGNLAYSTDTRPARRGDRPGAGLVGAVRGRQSRSAGRLAAAVAGTDRRTVIGDGADARRSADVRLRHALPWGTSESQRARRRR